MAFDNSATPPPVELANIDFEVEKEGWNTYELKDGTVIKGRMIVTRIARPKNAPAGQVAMSSQNIFTTFAPPEKRGKPAVPIPVDQIKKIDKYTVEVINSNEVWNVYKLLNSGDRIKVKLTVKSIE